MGDRTGYDEERLAGLIGVLPPAPEGWVTAAKELPGAQRGLDQILALAEADAEFRRTLIDNLEEALRRAGVEPEPGLVRDLRERLGRESEGRDR